MPPKEKKVKKKKEAKSDVFSAICELKIKQKQIQLSEAKEEFEKYKQINKELRQRNMRLSETRERDMAKAIDDYRTYNKEINSKSVCDKDQVIEEMKNVWKYKQTKEKELLDIRRETKRIEKEISNSKRELKYWTDFKYQGANMLRTQISLLKKELADMNENYEIISNSIREKTMTFINQIKQTTEEAIEKKNKTAANKAFKHVDQSIIEMSRENDWMINTIELYKRDLQNLKSTNSNLELENIEMMNYLFECNKEELKYVKKIFQTQFFEDENLEEDAIMGIDLTQLASVRLDGSLESNINKIKEINMETIKESHIEDSQDEFKFGSYEFKTLSLNGKKKDLIRRTTPTNEEFEAEKFTGGEDWPITQEMLNEIINYGTNQFENPEYDDDMDIKY